MNDNGLRASQHGAVALLRLDRPARLNALDRALIDALRHALDAIEDDAGTQAVVLTGSGERAFSAGADIHDFAPIITGDPTAAMRDFVRRGQSLTSRIESFPKPIVVAVNGLAYGGGCEIVEAAPLAVAADHATFAKPEIRLGFPPPFGGSQRLARLIGRKRAIEMILSGEPIGAGEARRLGLVNRVVDRAALIDEAVALARRVTAHGAPAVAASLAAVTRGLNMSIDEGLALEAATFAGLLRTSELREGVAAFVERRGARLAGQ